MNNTDCRNKSLWSACWDKAEEWFLSLQVPLAYISCIWPAPSLCPYISISGKTEAWIVRSVFCKRRSEISMLHSPAVNLLSSPRSRTKSKPSVWPFPSLCAEKVNSQLPCQQMLFPNSLSVLENFSPLFVQSEIQAHIYRSSLPFLPQISSGCDLHTVFPLSFYFL